MRILGSCYLYYLLANDKKEFLKSPRLYAIASDKEQKKIFENFRDMSLFACKKMDSKMILSLDYRIELERLRLHISTLRSINEFGCPMKLDVQTTLEEEENVVLYHDKLHDHLVSHYIPSIKLFKRDIQKSLTEMNYEELYMFSNELSYEECVKMSKRSICTVVDEFKVFMKLYGFTVKGV